MLSGERLTIRYHYLSAGITPKPKQATISIFALIKTTLQGYWLDTKYQGKWCRVFYREEKQALN